MDRQELLRYFMEHYYPRKEIVYRLPASLPIAEFWQDMLKMRRDSAVVLPLRTADGASFWYVPTDRFLRSADTLAQTARRDFADVPAPNERADGIMDEAFYSSTIEGAYSTRAEARALLESGKAPQTKDERMIVNNYEALRFVSEHLDSPINEAIVLEIARILTEGTLEEGTAHGWRDGPVRVISGRQEVVYVAPDADKIRPMLDDLFAFLQADNVHPVVKACAAHICFVTVHPLFDGNGRTARALAYMILLQAGYDSFRQVPISGLLAQERSKYYKAVRASQDAANGNDFTYFMEYYADMLCRSVSDIHARANEKARLKELKKTAASLASGERLVSGMEWLYAKGFDTITADKWKERFSVSFETARKDLLWLAEHGYLLARTVGHKRLFDVTRE